MLHFIIPLRSPEVSENWPQVSRLCNSTLQSVCNQTCHEYQVHLICHSPPEDLFESDSINLVEVDFSVPESRGEMLADKYRKIRRGLVEIHKQRQRADSEGKTAVMVVDADDRVSNRLAKWVKDHPRGHGWYFPTGYLYPLDRSFLFKIDRFHKMCGTSAIIYCSDEDLPENMDVDPDNFVILRVGHHLIVKEMRNLQNPLDPLPFPGACYVTDTSDNWSGVSELEWKGRKRFFKRLKQFRWMTSWHRKTFALYS